MGKTKRCDRVPILKKCREKKSTAVKVSKSQLKSAIFICCVVLLIGTYLLLGKLEDFHKLKKVNKIFFVSFLSYYSFRVVFMTNLHCKDKGI